MTLKNITLRMTLPTMLIVIAALCCAASAEWKEKVLYSFQGTPDGLYPIGALAFDKAGNLYGATSWGGADTCPGIGQCGTVYQLQPPAQKGGPWSENELYIFKGKNSNDGETPAGGVIFDASGNLYGTTAYGGDGSCMLLGGLVGCGTVYKMTPPKTEGNAWTESVVYSFKGGKDGYLPNGDLTFDSAGNLYGATQYGGGYGSCNSPLYQYCGTIFKLSPPKTKGGKWTEKVLYSFKSGTDGANPNGGLLLNSKGAIYGTTAAGGNQNCKYDASVGCGTAFELDPPATTGTSWGEKVLHRFRGGFGDGQGPNGNLIFDASARVFGTTRGGGSAESGTIFQLGIVKGTKRWAETIPYSFQGGVDGWAPDGGVVIDPSGNLYGTATVATTKVQGTVFRLQPSKDNSWVFTTLYGFAGGTDSGNPTGSLILRESGALFGTANHGGDGPCQGGCGTVFRVRR
jgi:hypothetical protein